MATHISLRTITLRIQKSPVVHQIWKWETSACFLVLAVICIIIATLYPHDGRPLPQWPLKISVNTLLSIYSMVLKGGLSFITVSCIGQLQWDWFSHGRPLYDLIGYDNAGRGAWGSLQLLLKHRLSQPLTALGGFLLILSVGIDPSIQQLISPSDCNVAMDNEKAILPRTNKFDDLSDTPTFGDDIRSAMLRGITQLGNGIYPECTTGNCSFSDSYNTIGYCSFCEDSSDEITIDSIHSIIPSNSSMELNNDYCGDKTAWTLRSNLPRDSYITTNPVAPSQLNVTYTVINCSRPYPDSDYAGTEMAKMDVLYEEQPQRPDKITVKILAGKTSFSDRHIDTSTGQSIEGCENGATVNSWRCKGYGAATCTLQPCVRVYNATVETGRLTEHLIAQSGTMAWATDPIQNIGLGMVDISCLTPEDRRQLTAQGYSINGTVRWLPYAVDFGGEEGDSNPSRVEMTNSLLTRKCLYFMSTGFVSSMGPFVMSSYLTGTVKANGGLAWGADNFSISSFDGPQIQQYIYDSGRINFDHIQETFSNISESLTAYIRTHGHENYSEPATGQVFHYAVCLQVRWQWMAFPSSVALFTIALFLATICSKSLKRFPAWKTSLLPWLMCGPGNIDILNMDELEEKSYDIDDMENMSKDIVITWKPLPNPHIQL
ncbi:hypothetical protein F4804DRAFT_348777 [Jackrogersella minutella]|nr:hypothetical protein F4804DRAFT_348777 [Jackrogersella minutella]